VVENKLEQELDSIRADLIRMREDMAALAKGARRTGEGGVQHEGTPEEIKTGETGDAGQEHEGWDAFQQALHDLRDRGETLLKDLSVNIKQYPIESAVMAFGIGYLIAKLMNRGRKS